MQNFEKLFEQIKNKKYIEKDFFIKKLKELKTAILKWKIVVVETKKANCFDLFYLKNNKINRLPWEIKKISWYYSEKKESFYIGSHLVSKQFELVYSFAKKLGLESNQVNSIEKL